MIDTKNYFWKIPQIISILEGPTVEAFGTWLIQKLTFEIKEIFEKLLIKLNSRLNPREFVYQIGDENVTN